MSSHSETGPVSSHSRTGQVSSHSGTGLVSSHSGAGQVSSHSGTGQVSSYSRTGLVRSHFGTGQAFSHSRTGQVPSHSGTSCSGTTPLLSLSSTDGACSKVSWNIKQLYLSVMIGCLILTNRKLTVMYKNYKRCSPLCLSSHLLLYVTTTVYQSV